MIIEFEFESPKLGTEVFFMKNNKVQEGRLVGVGLSRVNGDGGDLKNYTTVFYIKFDGIYKTFELYSTPFESKVELLNSL